MSNLRSNARFSRYQYGITDYEAALIAAAASASGVDWLVTRDEAGFLKGPVPSINPGDFLQKL